MNKRADARDTQPLRPIHMVRVQIYNKVGKCWGVPFQAEQRQALWISQGFLQMQGGGIARIIDNGVVTAFVQVPEARHIVKTPTPDEPPF